MLAVIREGQPERLISSRFAMNFVIAPNKKRFAIPYQALATLHYVTSIFGNGVIIEEFACQIIPCFRHHLGAMYATPKAQGVTQHINKYHVPKDVRKVDWVDVAT
jgi:hypothetical protein